MYYTLLVSEEPLDWQLAHRIFPSIAGCFNTTADGLLMEAVGYVAADKLGMVNNPNAAQCNVTMDIVGDPPALSEPDWNNMTPNQVTAYLESNPNKRDSYARWCHQ